MSSEPNSDMADTDSSMRPIEREILLAASGELSLVRRCVLRIRLLLDGDARGYAAAERTMRQAIRTVARPRRLFRRVALVPLATAAAVALAFGLWSWRGEPGPTLPSTAGSLASASQQMLETSLILRTRQLAIKAERSAGAPHTARLAFADPFKSPRLASASAPLWSSERFGVSWRDSLEK